MPGSDCDSDHVPGMCKFEVKLKKLNPIRLGGGHHSPPYTFLLITSDKMELFTSNHHENSFLCLTDGINYDLVKIDSFFMQGVGVKK